MALATTPTPPLHAQSTSPDAASSARVPVDHWSRDELRRLAAMGLINPVDALQTWPMRRSAIRALLTSAATDATTPAQRAVASAAAERFDRDMPVLDVRSPALELRAATGWSGNEGELLGGTTRLGPTGRWTYPGPVPGQDGRAVFAAGDASFAWKGLSIDASGAGTADDVRLDRLHAALVAGPVDLWAGRHDFAAGAGRAGSIVLSPDVAFDGVGIRTSRPIDLPGFLGDGTASLLLARVDRSGDVSRPWFSAATLSFAPTPGLRFGFNRAVLFGGDGNVESVSARNVVLMMLGITGQLGKDSGFENQVASLDVWTRMRIGDLPFSLYGELGVDDVGFSLFSTAALLAGVQLAAVPGLERLAIGLEYARFPASCCGHPPWYRHGNLGDGWTDRGRLLGHPLGGQGSQLSVDWSFAATIARLTGQLFIRSRGEENLFAPDRVGSSTGAAIRTDAPVSNRVALRAQLAAERGAPGWNAWNASLGLDVILGPDRSTSRHQRTEQRAPSRS
jgi:hypothetical protein